jgi:1,4-alpha-glucan branching enzyme
VPAWAKYSRQNPQNNLYEAVFWNPEETYEWKSSRPNNTPSDSTIRIYEAHVGMVSKQKLE